MAFIVILELEILLLRPAEHSCFQWKMQKLTGEHIQKRKKNFFANTLILKFNFFILTRGIQNGKLMQNDPLTFPSVTSSP